MIRDLFVKVACVADHGNYYVAPKAIKVDHRKHRRVSGLSMLASTLEAPRPRKNGSITIPCTVH